MEGWRLDALRAARDRLAKDPKDALARQVLEEAAAGKCESFAWFMVESRAGAGRGVDEGGV